MKLSKPQEYIVTSLQSVMLFMAGVGSGKTHIIGFKSGYLIDKFPGVPGFIGANTYMQLSQSTMVRVYKVWEELYGWVEDRDYVVGKKPPRGFKRTHKLSDYRSTVSFKSGALVFIGSLDNAKAHDGKEFGWAFLDETKDSREDDVKDVILARLRSGGIFIDENNQLSDIPDSPDGEAREVFNPLYICTSPAKVDWINEWFNLDEHQDEILSLIFDKDQFFRKEYDGKCITISSTYHNIENLPKGYIAKQTAQRSEAKIKMLIFGNPFVKSGGEFYSGFERLKHVKDVPYIPGLPIHISFDQNVNPYITATLHQVRPAGKPGHFIIGQFAEICLPNPKNKTSKLCFEFIKRYGRHKLGLFFYGDPSGKKSDTRTGEHDYKIVERVLKRYLNNSSNRVPVSHPSVLKRKDFINGVFEGIYPEYSIEIDRKCKYTIADYEHLKEDVNGKKHKHIVTDPATGIRYEKYGHTSDANDYLHCVVMKQTFKRYFK